MFSLSGRDLLALTAIIFVSYLIAFKTGLAEFIVPAAASRKKKPSSTKVHHPKNRGTITGKTKEKSSGSIIERFDILVIYRGGSDRSTRLAQKFSDLCTSKCELLNTDNGCDFNVLEFLQIPVVFVLDASSNLHDFIMKKESDPQGTRAYQRRHLGNLRFAVVKSDDAAFSQFIDEGLSEIGGKRIQPRLENEEIIAEWTATLAKQQLRAAGMSDCSHPVQMHGLCAICGLDLVETASDDNSIDAKLSGTDSPNFHVLHTNPHIKVTAQEAARIGNENMERLLGGGKLSLVVDLDQTVLHATVDPSVHEWLHDPNHPLHQHTQDIHKVALHDSPHIYYIKLRPGLSRFFQQLFKIFELHVYTMGSRSYAHAVVKLFDPDGRLFNDRILSRDDNEIIENRKKLDRIFPTDDRMVLVIDDRSDVWADCRNLIQVPAYTFFVGTGDINAPKIDGETGIQEHTKSTVINPNDEVLYTIERVLKMIHERFFREFEESGRDSGRLPDVKDILLSVKREIFSGCCFVFSGLLHQQSSFEEQEIWKLAREFGARCEYEIDDQTTHLISTRVDTEKALESKERGIPAVGPEWIYESCKKWEKLACEAFELEISGTRRLKRSASHFENDSEDSEEDVVEDRQQILDEKDFEEIEKELADLEEDSDFSDDDSDSGSRNNSLGPESQSQSEAQSIPGEYQDAELSDGDFSDLLNYSSNDDDQE